MIPNRWHGRIVNRTEGREPSATFPTYFRANTRRKIRKLARAAGLRLECLEYHNNYPSSLMFNVTLCRLGIAYDKLITRVSWLHWLEGSILGSIVKNRA